jgi:hypothetical protein
LCIPAVFRRIPAKTLSRNGIAVFDLPERALGTKPESFLVLVYAGIIFVLVYVGTTCSGRFWQKSRLGVPARFWQKSRNKFVIRRNPQESGKWEAAGTEAQTGMHNQGKDTKI